MGQSGRDVDEQADDISTAELEGSSTQDGTLFKRLVEETEQAIYLTDTAGTITYVNPAFEEITGYTAAEAIGQTPAILDSGEHSAKYFQRLWETILSGETWSERTINRRKNGDQYIANQTIIPITTSGEITHFAAIQSDITDQNGHQQDLTHSHDQLTQTEYLAEVGGWELDLATETLRWTDGTRRIHGVTGEYEPTFGDSIEFYHPEDRDRIRTATEQCRDQGVVYDVEARLVTAKGRIRWVRTRGERVERDGSTLVRGAIRDITDQKQREQRLMVLNRVLRHNLRNSLNVTMGYAEHLKEELAALDLPDSIEDDDSLEETIASITGLVDLSESVQSSLTDLEQLVDEVSSFPIEQAKQGARQIETTSQELLELAEKSRAFEKSYDKDQIVEQVDVRPLLETMAANYRDRYPEASITIEGGNWAIRGTREVLRRMVDELLENALKHTDQAQPTITLTVSKEVSDRVSIRIADTGPGIPNIERQTLVQGEETPLMHGSGIGLWLVNWLVTQLGGTVTIRDNDPRGTIVTLELPAAPQRNVTEE